MKTNLGKGIVLLLAVTASSSGAQTSARLLQQASHFSESNSSDPALFTRSASVSREQLPAQEARTTFVKEFEDMRAKLAFVNTKLATVRSEGATETPAAESFHATPLFSSLPQADAATAAAAPAKPIDPFSDSDWTWLNGSPHTTDSPLDSKYFSGEFRADAYYTYDMNHPLDDTIGGSSEIFRSQELQLEQISIGGDLHVDNVRGRILFLMGEFATGTPRNDASPARGQWDLRNAYRYVSEAYGGYHWDVKHGLNLDAGIFVSYIGLFSYYNFDNWAYQPSYVSSNTPWFFEGVRVQYFPTAHLKIEPWFINGWQSYGRFNNKPGLGGQIKWTPKPWIDIISNNYGMGRDDLGYQHRARLHTDDSIEIKYYDRPNNFLDRAAFSFTADAGCEFGDGVACHGNTKTNSPLATIPGIAQKQSFLGYMVYNRTWFKKNLYGITIGGGQVSNPGRYLALVLPINGADAVSGTPYFPGADTTIGTSGKSLPFKAWDGSLTFDYMPKQYITMRTEWGYRHSDNPYFAGHGGLTPPGGNNGAPGNFACSTGANSGSNVLTTAEAACGTPGSTSGVWFPDLRKDEQKVIFALMVKF